MKYFNISANKFLFTLLLLISTNSFALSEKALEGKELYIEASCTQCHGDIGTFDMKNKKATNKLQLTQWVINCDANLDIGWFPEEQSNVVEYLDETHYKYKKN
jgi:hypothetical protein